LKHYPNAIILPPKVYFYQPKMYGFQVFGKRGSRFYQPAYGNVRLTENEEKVNELVK
jgi:hypothetical protein